MHPPPPPADGQHWIAPLFQMLGRLESGQTLNREMAEQRAADLRQHMDARLQHLSETVHGRVDRVEQQVAEVKAAQAATSKPDGARPWWRDVTPREVLTWIATAATLWAVIRDPSLVDKLMAYALK